MPLSILPNAACACYHSRVLNFSEKLTHALEASGGLLCVGLDPDPDKLPADPDTSGADPLLAFGRRIVDATCDLAAAYKPQIAFYAALGAEGALAATIAYIRIKAPHALVILDAKRGDIGNTATAYAREAFERYGADAVTVNPYMGGDALKPFLIDPTRGAIVLCRTSNPGAQDFQDLDVGGLPLYRRVAERAAAAWNQHGNLMLVVGATYPAEMAQLRRAHPELTFLVPGIGAQGGDLAAILDAGLNAAGTGLLISASRSINYAGGPDAIRAAARELHSQINQRRGARSAAA